MAVLEGLWWKGPVLVLLVGLMLFVYLHDGPPYFEVSDLVDSQPHHEKILVALGLVVLVVLIWPPRSWEWALVAATAVLLLALAWRVLG